MAALLSAVTANTTGTGVLMSGPCTVMPRADSVFAGADVAVQVSVADTTSHYILAAPDAVLNERSNQTPMAINVQGAYYIRAVLSKANSTGSTSVTIDAIQ
jgi:hypothetical protein